VLLGLAITGDDRRSPKVLIKWRGPPLPCLRHASTTSSTSCLSLLPSTSSCRGHQSNASTPRSCSKPGHLAEILKLGDCAEEEADQVVTLFACGHSNSVSALETHCFSYSISIRKVLDIFPEVWLFQERCFLSSCRFASRVCLSVLCLQLIPRPRHHLHQSIDRRKKANSPKRDETGRTNCRSPSRCSYGHY
jgi:hypothetical protein